MPSGLAQSKEAHYNTLSWLWDSSSRLPEWLTKGSGLFAITGKPGSGKSVLMHEVATRVRKKDRYQFTVVVQHAFNTRGKRQEHSFHGFLCLSILQVLRECPAAFAAMEDEWLGVRSWSALSGDDSFPDESRADSRIWPIASLQRALRAVVAFVSRSSRVCFVLDALDECTEGIESVEHLVNFLKTLAAPSPFSESSGAVCVCLSCRDLPSTASHGIVGGFRMEDQNGPDIAAYIHDQWSALGSLLDFGDETKGLKDYLIKRSDGIFLWAQLALERLRTVLGDGATVAELRETLDDIPTELEGIFALLLEGIPPKYSAEANKMLDIVLCAKRPLSPREFRYAMALVTDTLPESHTQLETSRSTVQDDTSMKRRMLSRCGGLLEVKTVKGTWLDDDSSRDGSTGVVQFIHQSVKDYLLSTPLRRGSGTESTATTRMSTGHDLLSKCCLRYMFLRETQQLAWDVRQGSELDNRENARRFPLLHYAYVYGFLHCEEADENGMPQAELIDELFGSNDDAFETYTAMANALRHTLDEWGGFAPGIGLPSLLQYAIEMNLASYVDLRLTRDPGAIHTPLLRGDRCAQVAVRMDSPETLKVLLKHGADVTSATRWDGPSWLSYRHRGRYGLLVSACYRGNTEIVQMLLDEGAQLADYLDTLGGPPYNVALFFAAVSGNTKIVQMLLASGDAAVSRPEVRLGCVLALLANPGHLGLSLRLRGSVEEFVDEERSRKTREISQLIMRDIDINQLDLDFPSASSFWLLTGCRLEILHHLIKIGVDLNGLGVNGISFLHGAALYGTVASVQVLLNHGVDTDIRAGASQLSCLHISLWNETTAVLSYLLQAGLEVDGTDCHGDTALHHAARFCTDDAVDTLLGHGADRDLKNGRGQRAFHLAVYNRRLKNQLGALGKLLSRKADIDMGDIDGQTALHAAAGCGALPAVTWLLEMGADASLRDDSDRTVLHIAASSRSPDSTEMIDYLLDRLSGLDVNARDSADMTALHHAFHTYDELDPRHDDWDPDVALANATLLVRRGADLAARDNAGNTPLHFAAAFSVKEAVRVFLRQGADPHARDVNGLRPLDLAPNEAVREMLEHAMVVPAPNPQPSSPGDLS